MVRIAINELTNFVKMYTQCTDFKVILIGLTIFSLVACSDNAPSKSTSSTTGNPEPTITKTIIEEDTEHKLDWLNSGRQNKHSILTSAPIEIEQAKLVCGNSCPNNVGLLFTQNNANISRCTAFLIADNVVATNSHCLPEHVKKYGILEGHQMRVLFPNDNYQYPVTEVIHHTKIKNIDGFYQDFALLKLYTHANRGRDIVTISRKGFKPNKKYTLYSVDQESSSVYKIKSHDCKAENNLGIFPFYKEDTSPLITFTNCNIKGGNSGSPIFDKDTNEVIGLISAHFNLKNNVISNHMDPELVASFPRIALGTSFACIDDFSGKSVLSENCNKDMSNKAYVKIFKTYLEKALDKTNDSDLEAQEELMQAWAKKYSKIFKWKFIDRFQDEKMKKINHVFYSNEPVAPEIDCIKDPKLWVKGYKTMKFFIKSEAKLTVPIFWWAIGVGVDQNFKFFPKAKAFEAESLEIIFSPKKAAKAKGNIEVNIVKTMSILGRSITLPPTQIAVPVCKP